MKKILTTIFLVSCLVLTLNANVQALPYFQTFPSATTPAGWELTPGATISSERVGTIPAQVSDSPDWRILFAETGNGVATSPSIRVTAGTVLEFDFRAARSGAGDHYLPNPEGAGFITNPDLRVAQLPDGATIEIRANGNLIHTISNQNQIPLTEVPGGVTGRNAINAWRAQRIEIGQQATGNVRISFHANFPTPIAGFPLWYQIDNIHVYDNFVYWGIRGANQNIDPATAGVGAVVNAPFQLQNSHQTSTISQVIYQAPLFEGKNDRYITHLVYEFFQGQLTMNNPNFTTALAENLPIFEIWMADNVTHEAFLNNPTAWIPNSVFLPNLVYSGRVPQIITDAFGSRRIVIELDQPFKYTGGRLAIMGRLIGTANGIGNVVPSLMPNQLGHQFVGSNPNGGYTMNSSGVQRLFGNNLAIHTFDPRTETFPTAGGGGASITRDANKPNTTFIFAPVENGGELSVFFSTFTATHVQSNNTVNIAWETASESNLSGFHVLRSETGNLADARPVSDFFGASNSTMRTAYNFIDNDITSDQTYYYWIRVRSADSSIMHRGPISVTISETEIEELPTTTVFTSVYPNPLRTTSTATFVMDVKENETASLHVFNVRGQLVREFNNIPAGSGQRVNWDLTDSNERPVPTGIYFYRLSSPSVHSVQRLLIVK